MKELYRGAEERIFGILHPEEKRKYEAQAKLNQTALAKLFADNQDEFEREQRRRLEGALLVMSEDEPSRGILVLISFCFNLCSAFPATVYRRSEREARAFIEDRVNRWARSLPEPERSRQSQPQDSLETPGRNSSKSSERICQRV